MRTGLTNYVYRFWEGEFLKFEYVLPDNIEFSDECFLCLAREPSGREVITFEVGQDGVVSCLANSEGWQYLAKICIEMAHAADKDPFLHIHRSNLFEIAEGDPQAKVIFAQISTDLENEVLSGRDIGGR